MRAGAFRGKRSRTAAGMTMMQGFWAGVYGQPDAAASSTRRRSRAIFVRRLIELTRAAPAARAIMCARGGGEQRDSTMRPIRRSRRRPRTRGTAEGLR